MHRTIWVSDFFAPLFTPFSHSSHLSFDRFAFLTEMIHTTAGCAKLSCAIRTCIAWGVKFYSRKIGTFVCLVLRAVITFLMNAQRTRMARFDRMSITLVRNKEKRESAGAKQKKKMSAENANNARNATVIAISSFGSINASMIKKHWREYSQNADELKSLSWTELCCCV